MDQCPRITRRGRSGPAYARERLVIRYTIPVVVPCLRVTTRVTWATAANMRPLGMHVGIHLAGDPNGTMLNASSMTIPRTGASTSEVTNMAVAAASNTCSLRCALARVFRAGCPNPSSMVVIASFPPSHKGSL